MLSHSIPFFDKLRIRQPVQFVRIYFNTKSKNESSAGQVGDDPPKISFLAFGRKIGSGKGVQASHFKESFEMGDSPHFASLMT